LIAQYFRTIADRDGLVNTRVKAVVGQFENGYLVLGSMNGKKMNLRARVCVCWRRGTHLMRTISLPELIVISATILAVASLIGFAVWRATMSGNR
jgi:hypothetical protein